MNDKSSKAESLPDRPPATLGEALVAHLRPRPALPAVLVMFLGVYLPLLLVDANDGSRLADAAIMTGILVSAVLAAAAGLCSFMPPTLWYALAWWCRATVLGDGLDDMQHLMLMIGQAAMVAVFFLQAWRVATGRFIPTVRAVT